MAGPNDSGPPKALRTPCKAPKRHPRGPQAAPKRTQAAPKRFTEFHKGTQMALQGTQKGAQEAPKRPRDASPSSTKAPKSLSRAPKTLHRSSNLPQTNPQEALGPPQSPPSLSRSAFGHQPDAQVVFKDKNNASAPPGCLPGISKARAVHEDQKCLAARSPTLGTTCLCSGLRGVSCPLEYNFQPFTCLRIMPCADVQSSARRRHERRCTRCFLQNKNVCFQKTARASAMPRQACQSAICIGCTRHQPRAAFSARQLKAKHPTHTEYVKNAHRPPDSAVGKS